MPATSSPAPLPRITGLDGLRALAVTLVVVYHLFPGVRLAGGFIGVDVFFVISGFLITSLLLRERAATGRIGLARFWQRRARRLLPALAVMVTVCATAAWIIGGDVLVRLGEQVLGAVSFSYNWISIAGGTGYFSASAPELFRNLWSLAVEEQFYVVWPLLLPVLLLLPRRWMRAAAAVVLAAASATWMAVTVTPAADTTRAYFGTDTHAFGLLLGVALAVGLEAVLRAPGERMRRPAVQAWVAAAGAASVVGLIALAFVPPTTGHATFPGALAAASLLAGVAIVAGAWPGSPLARVLGLRPLRWIGDRSYGLYLWHWPLLVLIVGATAGASPTAGVTAGAGLLALLLTVIAATLSYRFVETPVRRHGFRGALARLGRRLAGTPSRRFGALVGVAAGIAVIGGTTAAVALAPDTSSGQAAVADGLAALRAQQDDIAATPSPSPTPTPTRPAATPPVFSVAPVTGDDISAVGDSVMLASAPALMERYPGVQIDAKVSRSAWAGPDILRSLADAGQLRRIVVVGLGTNGAVDPSTLDDMAAIAGPSRLLVLVTAYAPRDWIPGVNAELTDFAASHPHVALSDWSAAIADHVDLLAGDQVHPGEAGGRIYADTLGAVLDAAEQTRAEQAYARELRAYQLANGFPVSDLR